MPRDIALLKGPFLSSRLHDDDDVNDMGMIRIKRARCTFHA
jgi:hypothetical protein